MHHEGSPLRVAIVGGGASGTLVAIHLLLRGRVPVDITVLEPRAAIGLGAAYGTVDPWHRLNVPASTMTALPDDPDDFRRWAGVAPDAFPSRATWGRYLQERLAAAEASSQGRVRHVRARARRLTRTRPACVVMTSEDEAVPADVVVLATGNEPPVPPPFLASLAGDPRLVLDPWAPNALESIRDGEAVAIVGTGHTAVDLAASVTRRHPRATVVALSRHGRLPQPHEEPWRPRLPEPLFTVDEFRSFEEPLEEAAARIRQHGADWRRAMDSLRPIHQALWRAMDDDTRRRFVSGWRRRWEIHRSRLPAEVMRETEALRAGGRLRVERAVIDGVADVDGRLRVDARQPGGRRGRGEGAAGRDSSGEHRSWVVDRILLATGPDERAAANPFLAGLIEDGLATAGPLGIGLAVDPETWRVIDAAGSSDAPVHALGPIVRGSVWETIAIPEIRAEAVRIADLALGIAG